MQHSTARSILLIAALAAAGSALEAQSVPRVELGKPEARFADPFDNVRAVRELSDGRVIVADPNAKTVTLADFRAGTGTAIGREGQGPGEYAFPIGLVALAGDTTLLVDPGQRRFLVIAPNGKASALVPFPGNMMGLIRVKGADRQGRIYIQASELGARMGPGSDDAPLPDSVSVLRWDRSTNRLDTLGRVKIASIQRAMSGSANSRSMIMRAQPFSSQDDWSVGRDGRVGVVRTADYHAEWWLPNGQKTRGAPVIYQKIAVSPADKEAFRQAQSNTRGGFRMNVGGGGNGGAPPPPPPKLSEPDWPAFKPPFREGTIQVAPDGTMWVQRYGVAKGTPVYDVFDASGRLTRQVVLPAASRVVGFGATSVYVATTTDDELETLSRYRRP